MIFPQIWNDLPGTGGSLANYLPLAGGTMTGAITLAGSAVNPLEPVTLQQFNLGLVGLTPKGSVEAASDANINLASPASALVDGHTLSNGDRFLAQSQTLPVENGIYIFNGVGVAATRDGLLTGDDAFGAYVSVVNGATFAGQFRICVSDPAIVDTDDLVWDFQSNNAITADGTTIVDVGGVFSIANGGILDVHVNAAAAIQGTKIDPDFGSQNVYTTGFGVFNDILINGTTGSGVISLTSQMGTVAPTPAGGVRLFSKSNGNLNFTSPSGVTVGLSTALVVTDEDYQFPNASGTLALIPGSGFVTSNGSLLSSQPTIDLNLDVSGLLGTIMGGTGSTGYTQGSVIFANASQLTEDNANFFYDDTNNRLGLGTTSPSFKLQLGGTGGSAYLQRDPLGAYISGSASSPTKLVVETTFGSGVAAELALSSRPSGAMGAFEDLGWLSFFGRDDAGNQRRGAYIRGITSGAWTATSLPTHMDFFTVPSGSNSEIQRARLFSSGEMYFGSTGLVGNSGTLQVGALSSAKIGLYMQMQSAQTADAMRIVNNSGVPFFTIDADGDIAGKSLRLRATDSTGVIQIDAQTTGAFTAPPSGFKFSSDSTGKPIFINTAGNSVTFKFGNSTSRTYEFIDDSYVIANVPVTVGPVKSSGSDLTTGNIDLATEVTNTLQIGNGGTGSTSIAAGVVKSTGSALTSVAFPNAGVVTSNGTLFSSYLRDSFLTTTTQANNSNVTYVDATELTSNSLAPATYKVTALIVFTTAATTTGSSFRINAATSGGATLSSTFAKWRIATAANGTAKDYVYDQLIPAASVQTANTVAGNNIATVEGVVTVSVSGKIAIQFRSEVNLSAVTIQAGSYMLVERL